MIRYNTTDIIKRAEQLSDLENSDFISDYEKVALLNESWQIIYQKIVNANDKTWAKRIRAYDGMPLPCDMYQMSALYLERSREQILKRNSSQKYGYEIIGNFLYLSDNYKGKEIIMEYFPIPKSLRLREKTADSPFENNILGANHSLYIDSDNYIRDLNDSTVHFLIGTNYYDYAMFDNAVLAWTDSSYTEFAWWDYDGLSARPGESTFIPLIIENHLYLYSSTQKKIYDTNQNEYLEIDITVPNGTKYIYANKELTDLYFFSPVGYYYNDSDFINLADRKTRLAWCQNRPYAILRNTNRLVRCDHTQIQIIDTEYIPMTFVSEKYVLTRKPMSELTFLEGYVNDTDLNFSNNIYFIVLAYMLAIAFKNKQGGDTTALYAQYESAVQQLFDSISNDANDSYQIKNVYKNNGIYIW
jgi:hypothetical protein